MVLEFKLPDPGEGIHEGQLVKWMVKEGDEIKEDAPLAEIETDKAVVEIPSPEDGKILKLHAKEGDTVKVGSIFVTIDDGSGEKPKEETKTEEKEPEEKPEMKIEQKPMETPAPQTKQEPEQIPQPQQVQPQTPPAPSTSQQSETPKGKAFATPAVRHYAREKNVDINQVQGSGPGGRIEKQDIDNFLGTPTQQQTQPQPQQPMQPPQPQMPQQQPQPMQQPQQPQQPFYPQYPQYYPQPMPQPPMPQLPQKPALMFKPAQIVLEGNADRIPLSGVRKIISEHMEQSMYTAPHVTHFEELDVTDLVEFRKNEKADAEQQGIKLTYLPFIVSAVVNALKKFPYINSSLNEQTNEIVLKKFYNIGIAVETDAGLMVPVVKNAEQKTIYQIGKEINELAQKSRDRKISLPEMSGGTFTITNVGSIGGIYSTPIINYPEAAILGVHRIHELPRYINGELQPRKILNLALSFDHRIIDGATAASFVNEIKKQLEEAKFSNVK